MEISASRYDWGKHEAITVEANATARRAVTVGAEGKTDYRSQSEARRHSSHNRNQCSPPSVAQCSSHSSKNHLVIPISPPIMSDLALWLGASLGKSLRHTSRNAGAIRSCPECKHDAVQQRRETTVELPRIELKCGCMTARKSREIAGLPTTGLCACDARNFA